MRRLILWLDRLDASDIFVALAISIIGGGFFAFFISGARVGFHLNPDQIPFSIYFSSWLWLNATGWGVYGFFGHGWPRAVAWAQRPPKIAPRIPVNAFLEAAKREVEAIAPEHPDA